MNRRKTKLWTSKSEDYPAEAPPVLPPPITEDLPSESDVQSAIEFWKNVATDDDMAGIIEAETEE